MLAIRRVKDALVISHFLDQPGAVRREALVLLRSCLRHRRAIVHQRRSFERRQRLLGALSGRSAPPVRHSPRLPQCAPWWPRSQRRSRLRCPSARSARRRRDFRRSSSAPPWRRRGPPRPKRPRAPSPSRVCASAMMPASVFCAASILSLIRRRRVRAVRVRPDLALRAFHHRRFIRRTAATAAATGGKCRNARDTYRQSQVLEHFHHLPPWVTPLPGIGRGRAVETSFQIIACFALRPRAS